MLGFIEAKDGKRVSSTDHQVGDVYCYLRSFPSFFSCYLSFITTLSIWLSLMLKASQLEVSSFRNPRIATLPWPAGGMNAGKEADKGLIPPRPGPGRWRWEQKG